MNTKLTLIGTANQRTERFHPLGHSRYLNPNLPHQFYQISIHAQEQQIPTKTEIVDFPSMKSTSM